MTYMGRRSGSGDMLKSVYDPNNDGIIAVAQTEADMTKAVYDTDDDGKVDAVENHASTHEDGGADEIDATGLAGVPVAPLLVDGTAGRVLRQLNIYFEDGTTASTVKIRTFSVWNGDDPADADNLAKSGTVGVYTLESGGDKLQIDSSAFSGNVKAALIVVYKDCYSEAVSMYAQLYSNGIRLHFYDMTTCSDLDITGAVDGGYIRASITYITDA